MSNQTFNEGTICITNPLLFMTEHYIVKQLRAHKYLTDSNASSFKFTIVKHEELPKEIYITFPDNKSAQKFLSQFNNKSFEKTLEHSLSIKAIDKGTSIPSQENDTRKKIVFSLNYEKLCETHYSIDDKHSGLVLTDQDFIDRQTKAVSWLMKKISSAVFKGQSIMNISLPIFIFDKRTMLEVFACELKLAPYYLNRAFHTPDPLEKEKWMTAFLLSQVYVSPIQTKPFNPILGETFQTKIGDMNIYLEHTVNKPPTANFYCFDDARTYKFYGYVATTASTGANSVKATKTGLSVVEFKDGSKFRLYYPSVYVSGTTMGKKMFNYKNVALVVDEKNEYVSYVKFNPEDKGFFKKFLTGKKQKSNADIIKGEIYKLKDVKISKKKSTHKRDKKAKSFGTISGFWTEEILIDKEVFWKRKECEPLDMFEMSFKLPSDSSFRKDLILFIQNKEDEAQKEKEAMEEQQRKDRKLREEYLKKIGKYVEPKPEPKEEENDKSDSSDDEDDD